MEISATNEAEWTTVAKEEGVNEFGKSGGRSCGIERVQNATSDIGEEHGDTEVEISGSQTIKLSFKESHFSKENIILLDWLIWWLLMDMNGKYVGYSS